MKKVKPVLIPAVLLAITLAVLTGGCRTSTADPQIPGNPFDTTWGFGNEQRKISLSGNSTGHEDGNQSDFLLKLDNTGSNEPWEDEYCILLLDRDGIISEINHSEFSIPAGTAPQVTLPVEFPAGTEGAYGISVIIPGQMQAVTTIWVGAQIHGTAGPWPYIETCPHSESENNGPESAE